MRYILTHGKSRTEKYKRHNYFCPTAAIDLGALFLWLAETIKALLHEGDRTHHVT